MCMVIGLVACQPFEPDQLILLKTRGFGEVQVKSCMVAGEIIDVGAEGIDQHGFCWSEAPNPTIESGLSRSLGKAPGPGVFEIQIEDLLPNTTYHFRAFATGGGQTVYSVQQSFTTLSPQPPEVHTVSVLSVNENSAIAGGDVVDNGGMEVTSRGLCWAPHENPTIDDSFTTEGSGMGGFESVLEGLEPYTIYFFRAYATNSVGTGYGEQMEFRTLWDNSAILVDIDLNEYPTIQIGEQVWMGGHLRVTHYADETPIGLVEPAEDWASMDVDFRAYCYYDNDPGHAPAYGALYSWSAAMNGHEQSMDNPSGVQGVCPNGWHLPSDGEWALLELFLGMTMEEVEAFGWRGTNQGLKLKGATTTFWLPPNEGASNSSQFHALPGGYRHEEGQFFNLRAQAAMWTASGDDNMLGVYRSLQFDEARIERWGATKKTGMSVRCVKDY